MGLREDERDLKQVSHKKPFKKLFQDVLRLDESRGSVAKILRVVSELPKLLDELVTGVSQLASHQLSREKL